MVGLSVCHADSVSSKIDPPAVSESENVAINAEEMAATPTHGQPLTVNPCTVVRICLKLTHCHRLNLSETLVTRSYDADVPTSERSEWTSAAEQTSGRTSGPLFTVPFQTNLNHCAGGRATITLASSELTFSCLINAFIPWKIIFQR